MHYGTINIVGDDLLEARVPLIVQSDSGASALIEFVVDTGFTDDLALPLDIINRLNLRPREGVVALTLADGSVANYERYTAYVLWHGQRLGIEVLNMEGDPLIGMDLLRGSSISIDALPGGGVTITELTPSPA